MDGPVDIIFGAGLARISDLVWADPYATIVPKGGSELALSDWGVTILHGVVVGQERTE